MRTARLSENFRNLARHYAFHLADDGQAVNLLDVDFGSLPKRLDRDRDRIFFFLSASIDHVLREALAIPVLLQSDRVELATTKAKRLQAFVDDLLILMRKAADVVDAVGKFQFPKDLWSGRFRDPFKAWREEVRAFARKWELPPEVVGIL